MFHLFSKVYVYPDFMFAGSDSPNKLVISLNDDARDLCHLRPSELVYHNVDELFAAGTGINDWPTFFNRLMQSGNTNVFADVESSATIFVAFIKTLFPAITPELAFKVYNVGEQRLTLYFPPGQAAQYLASGRKRVALSKDEFSDRFAQVTPWEHDGLRAQWVRSWISEFSIEFHLATYFNDPSHLPYFKDKYVQLIAKACFTEVREWYDFFSSHFMMPSVRAVLNHGIEWDTEDWRGELQKVPELAWLFDDNLKYAAWDSLYSFVHLEEAYNLGQKVLQFVNIGAVPHIGLSGRVTDCHLKSLTLMDQAYYDSDHAQYVFKSLEKLLSNLGTLADEEVDRYIRADIVGGTASVLFDLLNMNYKFNPWLMHFIYDMQTTNNTDLHQLKISYEK